MADATKKKKLTKPAAEKSAAKSSKPASAAKQTPKKAAAKAAKGDAKYIPRLKDIYRKQLRSTLLKDLDFTNLHQVPTLVKVVVNMGLGNAREDANSLKGALDDLAVITGQKAVVTYAKKPISNFKIRKGDPVGVKVTLRGDQMWHFFDRVLSLAIPRIRDFRGLSTKSFDGRGNYSFGVTEQIIFPEIDYDKINQIRGMDITLVTSAEKDEHAFALLSAFGFPFRSRPSAQPTS